MGPKSNDHCLNREKRRFGYRNIQRGSQYEEGGRDLNCYKPRSSKNHQKLEEAKDSFLEPSMGTLSWWHHDLELLENSENKFWLF